MMNAFKSKAKRCCNNAYERLLRQLVSCEMDANGAEQRHDCYRQAAKASGAHAKACMSDGSV